MNRSDETYRVQIGCFFHPESDLSSEQIREMMIDVKKHTGMDSVARSTNGRLYLYLAPGYPDLESANSERDYLFREHGIVSYAKPASEVKGKVVTEDYL